MTRLLLLALLACAAGGTPPDRANPTPFGDAPPAAVAQPGAPAPVFTATDLAGGTVDLARLRGQVVVLEFFNPECPFVSYAHGDGTLAQRPATWAARGVQWIPVNSNKAGAQGSGVDVNARAAKRWDLPRPVVLDESGAIARAYGAKVTPSLAVIDPDGTLVYVGGHDDAPLGEAPGGAPKVWVDDVLGALAAGQPAPFSRQKAQGCTIKF
jgi:peroxiredoxin